MRSRDQLDAFLQPFFLGTSGIVESKKRLAAVTRKGPDSASDQPAAPAVASQLCLEAWAIAPKQLLGLLAYKLSVQSGRAFKSHSAIQAFLDELGRLLCGRDVDLSGFEPQAKLSINKEGKVSASEVVQLCDASGSLVRLSTQDYEDLHQERHLVTIGWVLSFFLGGCASPVQCQLRVCS